VKTLASRLNASLNPNQLGYLIFYVTNRCNFRCNFCFYRDEIDKGLKPDELTLDEIKKFSKSIGPLMQLSLTGGEPFLRKEFTEIADILITNTNPQYVTIPTNGSLGRRIKEFYEYMLPKFPKTFFRHVYSIEGIGHKHDQLREVKGSYDKIIKSFNEVTYLRKKYNNFIIDSNSVFTKDSEDSLLKTIKHLKENFSFDNLSVTYARGKIPDENLKNVAKNKYVMINDYIESIERNKETRLFSNIIRGVSTVSRDHVMKVAFDDQFVTPCVAGKKLIIVSETGDVMPCEILDDKIGNLKNFNYNLKEILKSNESKKINKWIKDTKCKCTFECATAASVVWNASNYPKILKAATKSYFRDRKKI
tara:strand:+ start:1229 stop:2317 length:1089 start_codon:yes stop_codon:yes gene_type:complete